MYKILVFAFVLLFASGASAQEQAVPDISGLWITEYGRTTCPDGTLPSPGDSFVSQISKDGLSYSIRSLHTYDNANLDGQQITAVKRPRYTVTDRWQPGDRTLSASAIRDLNRKGVTLRFQGRISNDGQTIIGTDRSFCFRDNGFSITDGPNYYTIRITMRRAEAVPAFVSAGAGGAFHQIRTFSPGDVFHIAAFVSEGWPERTIRANRVTWDDGRDGRSLGSVTLTRSSQDATLFLSPPITVRSAMVEDSALGANTAASGIEIWGRAGTTLTANLPGIGEAEASLALFFLLEFIMETTTALLLFAMLAFLVERLTNGICLILGYFDFWRSHFERVPLADAARNARNYRNRRVFLFFLGIAVAVPLCVFFGFNIIDQLQLPEIDPLAEQVGTGLLAATGADPIREIILGGEGGEGRFTFVRGGGSRTIQVEAQLVAPPGSTVYIAEGKKDDDPARQDTKTADGPEPKKSGTNEAATGDTGTDNDKTTTEEKPV